MSVAFQNPGESQNVIGLLGSSLTLVRVETKSVLLFVAIYNSARSLIPRQCGIEGSLSDPFAGDNFT